MAKRMMEIDSEVVTAAAEVLGHLNAHEVLGGLNMTEGFTLAALFDELGEHKVAAHIVREVWEAEEDGSRDPEPWVNSAGERATPQQRDSHATQDPHGYRFEPRQDWEDSAA